MTKFKSVVLIILDGWGLSPSWGGNALTMNNPKNIDSYWRNYPHAVLQALGAIEYGNIVGESRLGHLMIGAGREISGYHSQINEQIKNHKFYKNEALVSAFSWAKRNNSNVHLMGMISDGGVHADADHLIALLELSRRQNFTRVYIDAISDGIDSSPTEALSFILKIKNKISSGGLGEFSSIGGRNYAMDRSSNWEKIKKYYNTVTGNSEKVYQSADEAISENYRLGLTDEFVEPGLIQTKNGQTMPIHANDALIFFNFREDRAIQLAKVFSDSNFHTFLWHPKKIEDLYFATFIDYEKNLPAKVAFPRTIYPNTISEVLSKSNFHQLKIAESEKRTHVTSFFNGGHEEAFPGEDIKIISSPHVSSYDQKPEMSAPAISKVCCAAIRSNKYALVVINFANVDMIAHTGSILAVGKAVQVLDIEVKKIVETNLKENGVTIITADHGNAEQMINLSKYYGERETLHTLNPVPFILVAKDQKKNLIQTSVSVSANTLSKIMSARESLSAVSPTILELLGVPKPLEMTGHSLLDKLE